MVNGIMVDGNENGNDYNSTNLIQSQILFKELIWCKRRRATELFGKMKRNLK